LGQAGRSPRGVAAARRNVVAMMQVALEEAVGEVTGLSSFDLNSTAVAIALDMESAAIAADGCRFRVPYRTLLRISDKPLHGEIKLAGMASEFYRQRVGQHLEIGLKALKRLKYQESERLHPRKLRSFAEFAFQ
jgi:AMP nucleosidase